MNIPKKIVIPLFALAIFLGDMKQKIVDTLGDHGLSTIETTGGKRQPGGQTQGGGDVFTLIQTDTTGGTSSGKNFIEGGDAGNSGEGGIGGEGIHATGIPSTGKDGPKKILLDSGGTGPEKQYISQTQLEALIKYITTDDFLKQFEEKKNNKLANRAKKKVKNILFDKEGFVDDLINDTNLMNKLAKGISITTVDGKKTATIEVEFFDVLVQYILSHQKTEKLISSDRKDRKPQDIVSYIIYPQIIKFAANNKAQFKNLITDLENHFNVKGLKIETSSFDSPIGNNVVTLDPRSIIRLGIQHQSKYSKSIDPEKEYILFVYDVFGQNPTVDVKELIEALEALPSQTKQISPNRKDIMTSGTIDVIKFLQDKEYRKLVREALFL